MLSNKRISIIILNWNGLTDTVECLESLKKLNYSNYEVVLVDNASSGNDVEHIKQTYGDYVHIISNNRNYGFSEGNNIGIRYSLSRQSDYILLLNNDTIVDPVSLSELVQVAEQEKKSGILGGKIYYYDSPCRLQSVGGKINWYLGCFKDYSGQEDHGQYDQVAERDFVYATAMLIKREVIEKIGLLDSSFFFGMEDYDYCARAIRSGFKVLYVPKSKVWHKQGASRKKLPDHPETWHSVSKEKGSLSYKPKPVFRLFRRHSPNFLFPFASMNYIICESTINLFGIVRGTFYYIRRGELEPIQKYIIDKFKYALLRIKHLAARR